jgi:hypothetical protein
VYCDDAESAAVVSAHGNKVDGGGSGMNSSGVGESMVTRLFIQLTIENFKICVFSV